MKKFFLVVLCFCMLCNLSVNASDYASISSGGSTVENHHGTNYHNKFITLRVGETYTGSLSIRGSGLIEKKKHYISGADIVKFLNNTANSFKIEALTPGSAKIHISYERRIGINEISTSGASDEDVLNVVVIPKDAILTETNARCVDVPDTSESVDLKEITLKVGETYEGSLEVHDTDFKRTGYGINGSTSVVNFLFKSDTMFKILAAEEGTTIIVPNSEQWGIILENKYNPDFKEWLKVNVVAADSITEDNTPQASVDIAPATDYKDYDMPIGKGIVWNNHTYCIIEHPTASWLEAEAYCESLGGHLATISSKEENEVISSNLSSGHYYIGATDIAVDGVWAWVTGEAFTYSNWSPGEPNNLGGGQPFVLMYGPTSGYPIGAWDDCWGENGHSSGFVCEWDKVISSETNSNISIDVNGNVLLFDQAPVIENGRTLVPARAILESLGASVSWDAGTKTVTATKGSTQVSMKIGAPSMSVNGSVQALEAPAKIINNRTVVPVRAISEAFGCEVTWDGNIRHIGIYSSR